MFSMYYLYYNRLQKQVEITSLHKTGKGIEILDTNGSLESLVSRSVMYTKMYRCELVNECAKLVDTRKLNQIVKRNFRRGPHSKEVRKKIALGVSGDKNGRYRVEDPKHVRESKSKKLKFYYKYHVHGKANYKDSEQTRKMKSINNCNKGGWFWIHNRQSGEERRCFDNVPEGFQKGRLYNYLQR
jgi:hypothetical protein